MPDRVVLIPHSEGERDDRVSATLAELGYELDWRMPILGEELGEPDDSVAATVIYGGGLPEDSKDWKTDRYPFLKIETQWVEKCMAKDIPTVGICLGGQMIAHSLGAEVAEHPNGLYEFGYYKITPTDEGRSYFPNDLTVTEAHFHGFDVPDGATLLATGGSFPNQAFRYGDKTFGFQFHPEVSRDIFRRWQNKPGASYGKPGAQTREEQDALAVRHDAAQGMWIKKFITDLVGFEQSV